MHEKPASEASHWMMPLSIGAMMEMQRPAFTTMAEVNAKLCESIVAVNKEWASFVNRRLKEDLAVPQQLAECRTPLDFCQVYAQFFQNACSQYQAELGQMTKLGQSIAENALQSFQSRPEETIRTKH